MSDTLNTEPTPIVQFGTSRFLQAHVDLFVSEALADNGEAAGRITIVQTTGSAASAARVAAFNEGSFPVRLRGLCRGATIDETRMVGSVARAYVAKSDWAMIARIVTREASILISNTGDTGYTPDPNDRADTPIPGGFPAKLLRLLRARHADNPTPLTIYPCELVTSNGETLRRLVVDLAREWSLGPGFIDWANDACVWINSLVDRIVSEPIEPAGAVAEPYALWAIEKRTGAALPCRHKDITLTDDLVRYERLKLFILNLGHTWLIELWRRAGRPETATVATWLARPEMLAALQSLYDEEVLPVFAAIGLGEEASAYRAVTIERFQNPFLAHWLTDIERNHEAKRARRFLPLIELAERRCPELRQTRLRAALA